ncbi:MAG: 3-hydroxyacyl-CoA dehydrogenase NAD-binding domain-containing protein [Pseudomonadota bacterium]
MEGGAEAKEERRVVGIRLDTETPHRLDGKERAKIAGAIETVVADDTISGVVLAASDGRFPVANDPTGEGPSLSALCALIERCPKPVAAAIGASAQGPGLDLALAAHFRLAAPTATIGYPDVRLGLVPEGGGTQRLPRILGASTALDILLSGRPVPAAALAKSDLFDEISDGDPLEAAIGFVTVRAASGPAPEPTRSRTKGLRDAAGFLSACRTKREQVDLGPLEAPRRMIDCVEAALLLPFDEGIALEAQTRAELMAGPEAKALAQMSRAEAMRVAPKALTTATARPVETIGVFGAGRLGTELALASLTAGFHVILAERDEARLEEAVLTIIEANDAEIEAGRITVEDGKARIARLSGDFNLDGLARADLVVEALADTGRDPDAEIGALDAAMKAGAVLALTSTGAALGEMAARTTRSADVVGLRFFPPLRKFPAAELRQARESGPVAGATLWGVLKKLNRMTVISGGPAVADALAAAWYGAADWCLMTGAGVEEIDGAFHDWGARMGPFEARDLAGHGRVTSALPGGLDAALWQAGKRYYTYRPNGTRGPADAGVAAILDAARARGGFDRRTVPADEIVARGVAAIANAGAKAVRQRQIARPAEADLLAVHGLGLPRWRGGPLIAADIEGLLKTKKRLDAFAYDVATLWEADLLFETLMKNGKKFANLNG